MVVNAGGAISLVHYRVPFSSIFASRLSRQKYVVNRVRHDSFLLVQWIMCNIFSKIRFTLLVLSHMTSSNHMLIFDAEEIGP